MTTIVPGDICICIASRDRNLALERAVQSIYGNTRRPEHVRVAVYIDEDQREMYAGSLAGTTPLYGPRVGPCASLNALVESNPGYLVYGALTDDCEVLSQYFDDWLRTAAFENPVALIAPNCGPGQRMDFPFATARWVKALGYLAWPGANHFYWDVLLELVGEQTCIVRDTDGAFTIQHDCAITDGLEGKVREDAKAVVVAIALERLALVKKIRAEMARG